MLSEQTPPNNLQAALKLAANDWPVFPCIETRGDRAKSPYTKNGFHDATTDPGQIRIWWEYKPAALIGIAIPAWLMVIDIDPRNGGSRAALEEKTGPLPTTLTCWSGRGDGGQHLWFVRPKGDLTGTKLPPGVDLKDGGRGYVIAPPSLHPDSGLAYWEEDEDTRDPACTPYRLYELLKLDLSHTGRFLKLSDGDDDFSQLLNWVADTPEGCRNDYTFYAACRLAEKGALESHQEALLEAALSTGLSEREVQTCIESARRRVNA